MAQTFRRQPFSVSTSGNDYSKPYFFNQIQFKGLCDNQNDVNIDPLTFSDVQNMYVDENGILTSRPPFKLDDGESYIVDQWTFGQYGLRVHRLLYSITENDGEKVYTKVENTQDHDIDNLYFIFVLRCTTHDTVSGTHNGDAIYGEYQLALRVSALGWNFVPKITCAQIEDKIFVWFAGLDLIAFNTAGIQVSGVSYPYFENGVKYLYYPVHKLVINGIESDLETKNYLTETYRRRYQYSALSTVNFEKLAGRQMSVNMNGDMTQNKSKHLYDIIVQEHQDKMMLYPYSPVGSNYHIDVAQTPRATVVLRYGIASHSIEVSFDGRFFRPLPTVEDIIGLPLLTRDGLWVVAFTRKGLAKCKLVAQESTDFVEDNDVLSWVVEPYMRNVLINGFPGNLDTLDPSFKPTGYFETIDQFAYVFKGPSIFTGIEENLPYLYTEWLNGANDVVWGHATLIMTSPSGGICSILPSDDIKVHFRYVAPTVDHQELGAVVSILSPAFMGFEEGSNTITQLNSAGFLTCYFNQVKDNINRTLRNEDILYITEFLGNKPNANAEGWAKYVYRLDASGKYLVEDSDKIQSGDNLLGTDFPIDISETVKDYDNLTAYKENDYCLYGSFIYVARTNTQGNAPEAGRETDYWRPVMNPIDRNQQLTRYHTWWLLSNMQYTNLSWKFVWLCQFNNVRYNIKRTDNKLDTISPNKRVELNTLNTDILYTAAELERIFGKLQVYDKDNNHLYDVSWEDSFPDGILVGKTANPKNYAGNAIIVGLEDAAKMDRSQYINTGIRIEDVENGSADTYESRNYSVPCSQLDIHALAPTIKADSILYEFVLGYNLRGQTAQGKQKYFDCLCKFKYDFLKEYWSLDDKKLLASNSKWFKIMPNTDTVLTDKYLYCDGEFISIPQNGELAPKVDDMERNITSNDNLILALQVNNSLLQYNRNIHKLTPDGTALATGIIKSGDLVSYIAGAETEQDYLTPSGLNYNDAPTAEYSNRFYIERLAIGENNMLVPAGGISEIKQHELIRLRAYNKEIRLPVGNLGNPYDKELVIQPWEYPAAPADWQLGDDWPASFPTHQPIYANEDGSLRLWAPGDPLPTGPIMLYGITNIFKRIRPINIDSTGVWYNIDGTLWTSQVSSNASLELDEYVNTEIKETRDDDGNIKRTRVVDLNTNVPEAHAIMNEHYFSFVDKGKNLLEVTMTRRDENKLFSDEGTDLLLYLPKRNEQRFANRITALHPLSNTEMGIFTDKDIWYISTTTLGDNTIAYTKPIKSKIPVGLRQGNDVITALDGQALIFPTPRGLVALAPQDFVATTEKTLTYLTDTIQDTYHKFYNGTTMSTMLLPEEFEFGYKPFVRLGTYKYWIIMYKYFDREMFALDTRTGSWWKWTTPYPIRSIMVGSRLHVLLHMDFSPIDDYVMSFPVKKPSLLGTSFIWADQEVDKIGYYDDTIPGVLNGFSELVYENEQVGHRRILHYASPMINWYFVSQKLHFDQINSYKAIKGISINVKGDEVMTARMSTKAFRNLYHPEHSDVVQIKINDLRTFVKRYNLMHVVDFQYKIENDANTDAEHQQQFKLNSLSVKYEVKEKIR